MPASPRFATATREAVERPCAIRDPSWFDGVRQPESLGRFVHRREPIFLDRAPGAHRAALYSIALFDLETGPVTITLPRPGRRQMTLTAMDERHALQAVYHGPGAHTLSRERLGASRVMAVLCLMLDLTRSNELALAQRVQDGIGIRQAPRRRPSGHWTTFQASPSL